MTPPSPRDDDTPRTPEEYDFPWMPVYVDDLLALSAQLGNDLLGAFLRLRAYAWRQTPRCSLPDNDGRLAVISGLGAQWGEQGDTLRDLLTPIDGGRLMDRKLRVQFLEQCERARLSAVRRGAGRTGGIRSAEARGGAPPSNPRSNDRSNDRSKTAGMLRAALTSEYVVNAVDTRTGTEANAEAKRPAHDTPPLDRAQIERDIVVAEARGLTGVVKWLRAALATEEAPHVPEIAPSGDAPPADAHDAAPAP